MTALEILLPDYMPWAVFGPLGAIGLLALLYTAWVDARTGLVPPLPLLIVGLVLVAGAAWQDIDSLPLIILPALAFYAAIWGLNMAWRLIYQHDALGMGDASWSLLAALAYGWRLTVLAWGIGALLAIVYLGLRQLMRKPQGHVYFAPYLMAGLLIAIVAIKL